MRHRFEDLRLVLVCRLPVAWEHLPRGLGQRYVGTRAEFKTAEGRDPREFDVNRATSAVCIDVQTTMATRKASLMCCDQRSL